MAKDKLKKKRPREVSKKDFGNHSEDEEHVREHMRKHKRVDIKKIERR